MEEDQLKALQEEAASLRKEKETFAGNIAAKDAEIAVLRQDVEGLKTQVTAVTANLNQAVIGYRDLAIKAHPETPAELIAGETIEAVNAAVELAGTLVNKVREKLENSRAQVRVPPGAPGRTPPDFSSLSAREKIRNGISRPPQ